MGIFKWIMKTIIAVCVSVLLLSVFTRFYSYVPIHIENKGGNTDYVYIPNSFWSIMDEGIGKGRFDAAGYNNAEIVENPDILVLGSSHTEAKNVNQDENFAALMSKEFSGEKSVYNMGISGHTIYKVCQYLESSISQFDKAPEYIVIETDRVNLTEEDVSNVLTRSVEFTHSYNSGFVGMLQRVPFFHHLYSQLDGGLLDLFIDSGENEDISKNSYNESYDDEEYKSVDTKPYEMLFSYIQEIQEKYGTTIIMLYHPKETIGNDGNLHFDNLEEKKVFFEAAQAHNIYAIDMTNDFNDMYYNDNHVAHGFCNTELCYGHLNKYGHSKIAERLISTISNFEK